MCFVISEDIWQRMPAEYQEILKEAAKGSAESDRESNRFQTENLLDELEKAGMNINEPDLAPFADVTASVISDNASVYGDLYQKLQDWRAAH